MGQIKEQAEITEIFSSVQGEGLFIGQRHIFIRFKACNLNCSFCDTDKGSGHEVLDIAEAIKRVDDLNLYNTHNTVSLTGGEPLLYSGFLKILLPKIRDRGFKVYLETNGTLADDLDNVISYVDTISIDIKLPSVSKDKPCWQEHKSFLERAFEKEFFIKVIVSDGIDEKDFDKAISIVREMSFDIPFIIQPQTKNDSCQINISPEVLLGLQERALRRLNNVLVIPQAHKMMGIK
jgi:7-carboxy-7-deazaguanine synthase